MKQMLYFSTMMVMSVSLLNAVEPKSWTARGIGAGGGMFAPSYSPHDQNTLFLAIDMSDVLRTTDAGTSWTTVDFDQLQGKQNTQVQFTSLPNILFAQDNRRNAAEASIVRPVKSIDSGDTWLPFSKWSSSWRALSIHATPLRSDTFIVCMGNQIRYYRDPTMDGNFTVAHIFSGSQGRIAGVFWHTGNQEECWVATNEGFLYSSDCGQSFNASIAPPTSEPIASFAGGRDPITGQIRFHCITTSTNLNAQSTTQSYVNGTNHIWSLNWGDSSWTDVTGALTGNEHANIVVMSRNNANIAYVSTNRTNNYPHNCAVWRITTPGSNWTNIFITQGNGNITTSWGSLNNRAANGNRQFETAITYAQPCGLAVHPSNPDRVVICDNAVIHQCTNASNTSPVWQQIYNAPDNPGHTPGTLFPTGQSYLSNGLEATVWLHLDWVGNGTMLAACLDVKAPISNDNGARWGYPYDHSTLAGGDINAVAHDPITGRRYAAAGNTVSVYEYLGSDDAHTDIPGNPTQPPYGVYYQDSNENIWHPLKTNFGVLPGQNGASPVWLTFDNTSRKLYVSVVSSDVNKDGIYVYDVGLATWSELPTPLRNGVEALHPFNVRILPNGGIVASYCAHQTGDASISPSTLANGSYQPTSGVYYLPVGSNSWFDCTKNEMRYFTRDVIIDPHDPSGMTWFACVWNTDGIALNPSNAVDTPWTWGGLYRTSNGGSDWTLIWAGDATFSGSATSCTIHPEAALKDELLLTTRFGGLWITENSHDNIPIFKRMDSYRFRAPERAYYDPNNHDKIWVVSNGNGIVECMRPATFDEWRARNYGAAAADDLIGGPHVDNDGDGRSNLIEYIMGSNPSSRDTAPLSLSISGGPTLSFHRNMTASDTTITLEGSSDLQTWQTLATATGMNGWTTAPEIDLTELTDGTVTITDNFAATSCFYRIRGDTTN